MPIYHQEPENDSGHSVGRQPYQSLACAMLHMGPVTLYADTQILDEDIAKLGAESFDIRTLDVSAWKEGVSPHGDLRSCLGLPDYYGENLGALSDCMQDLVISDDGGMALVLRDYDQFSNHSPELAEGIIDVLAGGSRFLQLFGKTLLVLIHTNDLDASFGPLGATSANWNPREFVRETRGSAGRSPVGPSGNVADATMQAESRIALAPTDMLAYEKLRPFTDIEACECESVGSLLLLAGLTDNPLHCGACRREVDPERLELTGEEAEAVATWHLSADGLYRLWLDSGEYEDYAKARQLDPDGQVNRGGRELAAMLSARIPTRFWFFSDTDDGEPTTCPVCGALLDTDVRWGTGCCVDCRVQV